MNADPVDKCVKCPISEYITLKGKLSPIYPCPQPIPGIFLDKKELFQVFDCQVRGYTMFKRNQSICSKPVHSKSMVQVHVSQLLQLHIYGIFMALLVPGMSPVYKNHYQEYPSEYLRFQSNELEFSKCH